MSGVYFNENIQPKYISFETGYNYVKKYINDFMTGGEIHLPYRMSGETINKNSNSSFWIRYDDLITNSIDLKIDMKKTIDEFSNNNDSFSFLFMSDEKFIKYVEDNELSF